MATVLEWYRGGGPFMLPLVVAALAGLVLLVERLTFIVKRSGVNARAFMERVISLARAKRFEEALELCSQHHAALPDVGIIILRSRDTSQADLVLVAQAARDSFIPAMHRRLAWLPALAVILLLLGLAGAAADLDRAVAGGVALGPAVALACRPVGAAALMAVPLVAGWAFAVHQARLLAEHVDEFMSRLINAVAGRPEVRLGHRN